MDLKSRENQVQTAFVMMPFDPSFDDVYSTIREVVTTADTSISVIRLDEIRAAGSITEDLARQIRESTVCIADVTGASPNVMWEAGYAAALGKPLIVINQKGGALPFDIKDVRTVLYDRQALSKSLRADLGAALKATLEKYISRRVSLTPEQQRPRSRAITVTGSMQAPRQLVTARLKRVLEPYIKGNYNWYTGSYGNCDEAALQYLIEMGESSIAVVGYSSYDISPAILNLLEEHRHIAFIDAAREQIPRAETAQNPRDVLFAARSDLIVTMWDGASPGTKELLQWLDSQQKDHIIGFIPSLRGIR
jgi:hypothetical protein